MIAYLDSSAILRQYLRDESGSADVDGIMTASELVATCRLTFVEVRAGLAAANRSDRLDRVGHQRAISSFVRAWASFGVVDLSVEISGRAGVIAETYGLRAGDAIQLASALELDPREEVVVVAWDTRFLAAAAAAGLAVFPSGG